MQVCIACNPGLGHFHPCVQLAKALVQSQNDVHCTMFIPIDPSHKPVIVNEGELVGPVQLAFVEQGVEAEVVRINSKIDCALWILPNNGIAGDLFKRFCDLADGFLQSIIKYYGAARSPTVIVGDIVITYYMDVAKYYGIQSWQFNPSPLALTAVLKYLPMAWDSDAHELMREVTGLGNLNVADMMKAPAALGTKRFSDLTKTFLKREQTLSGMLANDIEDWYPRDLMDDVRGEV